MSRKDKSPNPASPFAGLRDLRDRMVKEEEEKAKAGKKPAAPPPPRAPVTSGAAKRTSDEDALEFHRLMSGVVPLDESKHRRVSATADVPPAARAKRADAPDDTMEHLRVLIDEGSKFEVSDDGRHVEGHRVDVPPDFVRRLRRGGFPIDGSLDLHGRSAAESRELLANFLRDKRARGERCVLVIHGKGEHSPGGAPVLRGEISAWLSQGAASVHVAAFATAEKADGGEGALYVLLRR